MLNLLQETGSEVALEQIAKKQSNHSLVLVRAVQKFSKDQDLKDLADTVERAYVQGVVHSYSSCGKPVHAYDDLFGSRRVYAEEVCEAWYAELEENKQLEKLKKELEFTTRIMEDCRTNFPEVKGRKYLVEKRKRVDALYTQIDNLAGVAKKLKRSP